MQEKPYDKSVEKAHWRRKAAVNGTASLLVTGLATWGLCQTANGAIITPNETVSISGEASPAFTPSDLLYDSGDVAFNGQNSSHVVVFSGELDSQVYTDPSTGDLDFVYNFSNDALSPDPILVFSASFFNGLTTDADFITGSAGTDPATVQRNVPNQGGTISFNFPGGVSPGDDAAELIIKTNSLNYSLTGLASFQDGGNVTFDAPGAVPEPASAALMGIMTLGLAMRKRRTRE